MIKYFLALLFAGLVFGEVPGGEPAGLSLRDSSPLASLRITGGEKVKPKEIPYQLFLLAENETTGDMHMCGASIYNSVWALTAAHCVVKQQRNPGLVTLYAGELNWSSLDSAGAEAEKKFRVSKIVVHSKYDYDMYVLGYDIALLRIAEEFKFSEFVKAVELSEGGDLTNEWAVVSGWGATHFSGMNDSNILLKAEVQILPWEKCRKKWRFFNESIQICTATTAKKGSCDGDSGGPLVVRREQVHVLVGIVSYGGKKKCNLPGYPAVYTKVSYFIPWIKRVVK